MILAVMKILLWEEERALVTEMNEYRNNLSRRLLNRLSELGGRPVDLAGFGPSFKAGWQRGVFVCRVPERHERGYRDIVIRGALSHVFFIVFIIIRMTLSCVHLDDLLVVSSWTWLLLFSE